VVTQQAVGPELWARVPVTLSIAGVALAFSFLLGIPLGVLAGLRPGGFVDRGLSSFAALLIAIPSFWLALLLVAQLSIAHHLLPAVGYVTFATSPWEWFRHLILPGLALCTFPAAEMALQLRASLVDTMRQDFILAARARGLRSRSVVFKHGMKSAAMPVVTILGLRLGLILSGTVIVEQIFAIQGVGAMVVAAATSEDVNALLAVVMLVAVMVLVMNALADITVGWLNPKVRPR
jgi:peptide/nickel transport system permease protein